MGREKHPPGLYVLFLTEMWERFGFYSMLAMFTLYLQNPEQGFGWTEADATRLYSLYLTFVYASPFVGGLIADLGLGYRRSVLLGGLIFMVGYFLLTVYSLPVLYLAVVCLVVGNGFFKPNVSAMVGHLYPEGSALKDRAYNLFYMGINIGAFFAPLSAGLMVKYFGFHPAFAVAGFGMIVSVAVLWSFRQYVESAKPMTEPARSPERPADTAAVATDLPPQAVGRPNAVDAVPDWQRIAALLVIFAIVIVFWMVFHQNGSTLTYWAKDNTDWSVTGLVSNQDRDVLGIISNVINPFWVVTLTFPVVWFWRWLDRKGLEPATPTKMALGMALLGLSFFLLYAAAETGESGLSDETRYQFRVSLWWLVGTYLLATLGELMLSHMGLSLVSKVAPVRLRGLMMGGWFVATAIGNSLTRIGVYWKEWWHSSFFAVLGGMALVMAVVLFLLLKPLKKAMPGV
jgi:POT family proton-dependent oligopeptide transporter